MSTDRAQILNRIANLRARAENGASSEAEVNAAITKAAKMMQAYNVSEAELAVAENDGTITIVTKEVGSLYKNGRNTYRARKHRVEQVLYAIQQFTQTKCVMGHHSVEFTGATSDVEMAEWLFHTIKEAMDTAYDEFRKENVAVGRGAKASFQLGMARRISERLIELRHQMDTDLKTAANDDLETTNYMEMNITKGTALVALSAMEEKIAARDEAFAAKYPRLGTARSYRRSSNTSAYQSGRNAGNRIGLGRPVGGSGTLMIA